MVSQMLSNDIEVPGFFHLSPRPFSGQTHCLSTFPSSHKMVAAVLDITQENLSPTTLLLPPTATALSEALLYLIDQGWGTTPFLNQQLPGGLEHDYHGLRTTFHGGNGRQGTKHEGHFTLLPGERTCKRRDLSISSLK